MTTSLTLPEQICAQPRVYLADGFATASEIDHVLARYGRETPPAHGRIAWDHGIAGCSGELPIAADPVLTRIAARIDSMLGFGCALDDATFRFRRYSPGDFHPGHVDCYEIAGQHLVATALLYLTDVNGGGETAFPRAHPEPIEIAPRRGRLALWFNYTPDGEVDRQSFHASETLQGGVKSTLAYFVYAPLACAAREPAVARELIETT